MIGGRTGWRTMRAVLAAGAAGVVLVLGACGGSGGSSAPFTSPLPSRSAASTSITAMTTTETYASSAVQRTMVVVAAPPDASTASGASGVDGCVGTGAYAELAAGEVVRVVDGSGALITSVGLGPGRLSGQAGGCSWSAEVSLPTDRGSYRALIEGWGRSGLLSVEDLYRPIVITPGG